MSSVFPQEERRKPVGGEKYLEEIKIETKQKLAPVFWGNEILQSSKPQGIRMFRKKEKNNFSNYTAISQHFPS